MKICDDFDSITHQDYEDAGCFGCSFLQMWTDGYYDCMHEKRHYIVKRIVESKTFGLKDMVVRYDGD